MRGRLVRFMLVLTGLGAAVAGVASSTAAGASAATPACATRGLVVWLNTAGNGYAGGVVYQLMFTNLSGRTCTLRGYPGVSAVNLSGRRTGPAAGRDLGTAVRTVRLRPGRSASSAVRVVNASNYPSSTCRPTTAAGLRVYPPGQRSSRVVPFPFATCAGSSKVLAVRPVAP